MGDQDNGLVIAYATVEDWRLVLLLVGELAALDPLEALFIVRRWCYDVRLDYKGEPQKEEVTDAQDHFTR